MEDFSPYSSTRIHVEDIIPRGRNRISRAFTGIGRWVLVAISSTRFPRNFLRSITTTKLLGENQKVSIVNIVVHTFKWGGWMSRIREIITHYGQQDTVTCCQRDMRCVHALIRDTVSLWLRLARLESYGLWRCYCPVFPVVFRRVYLVCDLKDDLWLGRILSTFLKHCLPTFERTAWYMPTMLVYWHRFHLVLCSCSVGINGIDDNRMRCILFTMKGPKAMITLTKKKFAAKWIPTLRKVWPSF